VTKQEKARWLVEMYTAVANGKLVQYKSAMDYMWRDSDRGPDMDCDPECWRIKSEPREATHLVTYFDGCEASGNWVKVPDSWPEYTKVRVTEIIEE
jgi:hypothetical protein